MFLIYCYAQVNFLQDFNNRVESSFGFRINGRYPYFSFLLLKNATSNKLLVEKVTVLPRTYKKRKKSSTETTLAMAPSSANRGETTEEPTTSAQRISLVYNYATTLL